MTTKTLELLTIFQSTHPTRGCDQFAKRVYFLRRISIHAPHEGVRPSGWLTYEELNNISIHAPHEGVRR